MILRNQRILIDKLAFMLGVSESSVIAAQRILGYSRLGKNRVTAWKLDPDQFCDEIRRAHAAEQAAANRLAASGRAITPGAK